MVTSLLHLEGRDHVMMCQGVALLPFVDEQRLLQALSFVYPNLTAYEGQSITSLVLYVANYIYMQGS